MVSDEEFTELEYRLHWAEEERDEAAAHARALQDQVEELEERVKDLDRINDKLGAELAGFMSLEDESADEEGRR